ncbi:MAG: 4Fe-4S dicluster domain-containing protein [bacterium]
MSEDQNNLNHSTIPEFSADILPPEERILKRPVAIIECFQEIPCNPCVDSCPQNAISIDKGINRIPQIDYDLCTGCTLCVPKCPGLAIFVVGVDKEDKTKGSVTIPYEFNDLPHIGEEVIGLNRQGKPVTPAVVKKVIVSKITDKTAVITLSLPSEFIHEVRFFKRKSSK